MKSRKKVCIRVQVLNSLGIHARPATALVSLVNAYSSCTVTIFDAENDCQANGNSVISVLSLGASQGTWLDIEIEGENADILAEKLTELINQKFGEE